MASEPVIVTHHSLGGLSEEKLNAVMVRPPAETQDPDNGSEIKLSEEDRIRAERNYYRALSILGQAQSRDKDVLYTPDDHFTALLQSIIADYAPENEVSLVSAPSGGKELTMANDDFIMWAVTVAYAKLKNEKHPFLEPNIDRDVTTIPDDAHLVLLGDWGSGLYGAPHCAASIEKVHYDVAIHLGDVYYAGSKGEIQKHFLDFWPKPTQAHPSKGAVSQSPCISRAVNANHEMYSGGLFYFGNLLPQFLQRSSCFALQNSRFLFVGLDAAYRDGHFSDAQKNWVVQIDWLEKLLHKFPDHTLILFSHHQPISRLSGQNISLLKEIGPNLSRVKAWYWGHEHRCILYDKHKSGFMGRCVGHSGFPYERYDAQMLLKNVNRLSDLPHENIKDTALMWSKLEGKLDVPHSQVLDGPNRYIKDHSVKYGPNGYMSLHCAGKELQEVVHDADGRVLYDRPFSAT